MSPDTKIKSIDELAKILERCRQQGMKIVHCHGVFDLLHIGHIRYFEQARRMGDVLVVTVTPDRFVDKGPNRPAFTEILRAEAIASMGNVDYVAINNWPTAEETLRILRPHVYVKGSEFKDIASDPTGKIAREAEVVREVGAELAFTEDIVFSSSNLINRYLSNLPEEIQQYLEIFRQRFSLEDITGMLDKAASLNVLVIGDTILDEYQYVHAIGKSSKDPILAVKFDSSDLFAGGVLTVANHISDFVKNVKLVTILGREDSREEFIRSRLNPKIDPYFAYQAGAPTIQKKRIIDGYTFNKLIEVYVMDDSGICSEEQCRLCEWLEANLPRYDLVIAADFGHGTITRQMVDTLVKHSRFLAVNTQANAGNRGFHTVTRYPHADYACIAEHELRLEVRDIVTEPPPLMESVARKLGCGQFVVTRGRKGCIVRTGDGSFIEVPSFAIKTVDRVGAGDAFFSLTAPLALQQAPAEALGFVGNVVGALAVGILGNQKSIDKMSVVKYITSLMK